MSTPEQIFSERGLQEQPEEGHLNELEVTARDQAEVKLLTTLEKLADLASMMDGPEQPVERVEKVAHACLFLAQAYAALCATDQANYQQASNDRSA